MTVVGKPVDVWAKDHNGMWYHIWEGTGDNLLPEDVDAGYVDYLNYEYYETLNDVYEQSNYDGGMILLKKLCQDCTIKEILKQVEEFENVKLTLVEQD